MLNLCSGRRRDADVQCQLMWTTAHEDYTIMMLSCDIAIDAILGDLTNRETVAYWLEQVKVGRVVGAIMGPPCETLSVVRFMLSVGEKLPPPLRSDIKPWGLDGLTARQYEQLYLSNVLLHVALSFFAVLLGTGGFCLIEHPALPARLRAPSIWKLSYVEWLLKSPAVTKRTFNQSVHGQMAIKPTTFLLLRLDGIKRYLYSRQGQYAPLDIVGELHGRGVDGKWNTSRAKEYPPSLCLAIARAIKDAVDSSIATVAGAGGTENVGEMFDPVVEFAQFHQQLDVYDPATAGTAMGADCMLFNR